jgi:FKBP-type peptidyl-prolyl cis-trans isomerase 2
VTGRIYDSESYPILASRKTYTILIALLLVSIATVGYVLLNSPVVRTESLPVVERGDMVYVDYVGYFADKPGGWVFDTNIRKIAMDDGITKSLYFVKREPKDYKPLNFTAGTATNLLKPFVDGVIGMTVTETKTIYVPVDKAYPVALPALRTNLIDMEVPVIYRLNVSEFEKLYKITPTVGMTVKHAFWEWDTEVIDLNSERVIMQNEPQIGMIVSAFGNPEEDPRDGWYQQVISIDPAAYDGNGLIIVRNLISPQDVYQKKGTDYDKKKFTLFDVDLTNRTFTVILNEEGYIGELAGRALIFEVTVTRVLKR